MVQEIAISAQQSVVADMGNRLVTIDMGRKVGADLLWPFFGGIEEVRKQNNCRAQALT